MRAEVVRRRVQPGVNHIGSQKNNWSHPQAAVTDGLLGQGGSLSLDPPASFDYMTGGTLHSFALTGVHDKGCKPSRYTRESKLTHMGNRRRTRACFASWVLSWLEDPPFSYIWK
ncbi:hypothetical protein Naga_100008g88 [Nannochloropsis gaditana]|uniref:Uncharacterized protein n=1 Tax=Nannochloropsis gaditana TaxID=72520 RepID=W7U5U4_9STRA|nr:hypothetical protein Naga_100008g88 [Nannochloropsis gaditana]